MLSSQAHYRGFLQRKYLQQKQQAATIIQKYFRAYIASKKYQNERNAVIKIQSTVRMWLARKTVENMKLMRLQNNAATIIQVCWGKI